MSEIKLTAIAVLLFMLVLGAFQLYHEANKPRTGKTTIVYGVYKRPGILVKLRAWKVSVKQKPGEYPKWKVEEL